MLTALSALAVVVGLSWPAETQQGEPADPASVAQLDPALEKTATEVASALKCPVCLNLSIEDSPSQLAREMKQLIREMLVEGSTPEEVQAYFVGRYGEWVLLTPEPRGINLLVWLLPALVVLASGAVVVGAVRRWVRQGQQAAEGLNVPDDYIRRIRSETGGAASQ